MKWEILKCDRCLKEGKKDEIKLHEVMVSIDFKSSAYGRMPALEEWRREWCNECCTSLGMKLGKYKENRKESDPIPPTLEDMVREIVREEMSNP